MPSKLTFICVPCRRVDKAEWSTPICVSCKGPMRSMGKHWSAPKKNNDRAWKRIENGDHLWNHRKLKKRVATWYNRGYRSNHSPDMGG